MPQRAGNEPIEKQWARQLERDRLRRVKTREVSGSADSVSSMVAAQGTAPSSALSGHTGPTDISMQRDWGRRLERQRMAMMMQHGPWLPGPGASAATATMDDFGGGMDAIGDRVSQLKQQADRKIGEARGKIDAAQQKVDDAKEQFRQHGLIGLVFAFLPPQAQKGAEEATKPVLKQLLIWHWGLLGTIKGALIAIPVTGPVLNLWLYKKHFKNMPGICKFDPIDLAQLLLYDLIIFLAVILVMFQLVIQCLYIYALTHPREAIGFVQSLGSAF